tara:strand:- start:5024 stop:5788 length:765 start_codon:yes stop_codon:yes gene_type:complete
MKFLKILLKPLLLISLLFSGLIYYKWVQFSPRLDSIQPKNPERYEFMISLAKDLKFRRAKNIFDELEAMTADDVIILRFNKLRRAWNESEDYRDKKLQEENKKRKEQMFRNQRSYSSRAKEVLKVPPQSGAGWVSNNWVNTSPWNKALILRQKCVNIMNWEIKAEKSRKDALALPRTAPFVAPQKNAVYPVKLCESWVPLTDNEGSISLALKNLRDHLEFFQFKKLLQEIGIPEKEVMDFEKKTKRFTAGYSDA